MTKQRWVLNRKGVAELLKSPEVRRDLERRARAVAAAAGPGHEVAVETGPTRVRATVTTATTAARLSEARHRTLTRAVEVARR
jgi:hypothetical protein